MEEISMEDQTIRNLVFNLESEVGSVSLAVITLNDIRTLIGHLRDNMDNGKEHHIYFMDYHRSVRVLDELIRYTVNDLNEANEKLHELHHHFFEKVVKKGEV